MDEMKRLAVIAATVIAGIGVTSTASAQTEGCGTVDYQGAPTEVCPPPAPDPTNCYTGDYQGAPVEVCLPTGEQLPDGTVNSQTGEPYEMHASKNYIAPAIAAPVSTQPAPSAPVEVEVDLSWVYDFVAILGW